MEIEIKINTTTNNIIQTKPNATVKKPPTRLQARAPASLELGKITFFAAECPISSAIPLLSPLVLSPEIPAPKPEIDGDDRNSDDQQREQIGKIDDDASASPKSPWQHSDSSTFDEPCYVFSFFHSQCVINPAQ